MSTSARHPDSQPERSATFAVVEVDHVEEGRFDKGQWAPGRALNGDERLFTLPLGQISAVRVRLLSRPH